MNLQPLSAKATNLRLQQPHFGLLSTAATVRILCVECVVTNLLTRVDEFSQSVASRTANLRVKSAIFLEKYPVNS